MFKRAFFLPTRAVTPRISTRTISELAPFRERRPNQPLSFAQPLAPRIGSRWQSTEAQKVEGEAAPADEAQPSGESEMEDPMKKELEAKNREIIDLKHKYLRSVAEFRNLQDRTRRDIESARQFAIQRFATDLIESIDNLDRALNSVPPEALNPDPDSGSSLTSSTTSPEDPNASENSNPSEPSNKDLLNLHAGLTMTESILMSTLKKHGLERFDPMDGAGRKFDPRLDEATFMTKVEGKQDGDVFHTQSKGFTLNGRVLRAAKVGVVQNS